MCLISKRRFPRIARKDIECYKFVCLDFMKDEYTTPLQDTVIDKDIINGTRDFIAEGKSRIKRNLRNYLVSGGFIHAYLENTMALSHCSIANRSIAMDDVEDTTIYQTFKCVIPKGTRYYVGYGDEICAKKIRFIGRLESQENAN